MLHNYYLYEENGKLSMLPWDYNLGFGAFSQGGNRDAGNNNNASAMVNMAIDTPLSGAKEEDRPMWSKLIHNETYKTQYHELFNQFLANYIENGKLEKEIDHVVEMISPYVEKDPTAFYTYDAFQKAAETLKTFVSLRGQSIRAQLSGEIPSTTKEQNSFEGSLIDTQ